ncbi:MarR family winged helix-turn-helix transcriptional regulator [Rhodococcus kronopolitis]|uniref:MarR family winged helix-turn-helix transcriptional regulator n=1 Tax=Rhodococcus kronopolitis TaxID=1460226 RepID=A0ABV9FMV5_9NOCA
MVSQDTASDLIDTLRGLVVRARAESVRQQFAGALPSALAMLLGHIARTEGHRPSMVAEELRVTQSALSRQVAQAESLGYVQRHPDPLDGRAALLSLTAAGNEALQRHRDAQARWVHDALADWSEDEARELADRLDRFSSAIDAHRSAAPARR